MDRPEVLVTQVQSRGGLAVIRSLGAHGIRVTACDSDRVALGFFSRYCQRHFVTPDPARSPDAYTERIMEKLRTKSYDVIIPVSGDTLPLLARERDAICRLTRFPFLHYEALRDAADKAVSAEQARAVGLRVPHTFRVDGPDDVRYAMQQVGVPVIVRPRLSKGSEGLYRVERADAVWSTCQAVRSAHGPVIVQEYIPWGGYTYDVDVLMNERSEERAAVVCKRLRMYPPLAGPTALGQAVDWPELRERAVRLLKHLHWYGPAEVEFRADPRDGTPVFTEINARFWGSLFTGMAAGVDFPYMLYRLAMEGDCPRVDGYRTDVKVRYFLTEDLLCMVFHPRKRSIMRAWFGGFFDRKSRDYLLSRKDPLPLLGRILAMLTYGVRPSRVRERLVRTGTIER